MKEMEDIHMKFRDVVSVSLLFAALEKDFPLLHSESSEQPVDSVEKTDRTGVFHAIRNFSTSFPHFSAEERGQ
ncbi:MAG TPA: hypothetical protein PKE66_08745 [Pyrinomonadaceae bacterium]|nr:hypothetical protein [Pyrinomonadaceae bacterium]